MRPLKLTMVGLRSYRDKTEIDFTDLSLFALIGDTGAGKSSVIEALCLALYGSTTWSGRNVVELMCDASEQMAVELVFAAGGDTWTVTRSHRRTGAPTHKLTSVGGVRENGADGVNKRVQAVLGLSKDQFLKAVVMPQGRFEELLKASKGQRTDILKGVFRLQNLDAVRTQVGALAARWKEPIAALRGERSRLPDEPIAAIAIAELAHDDALKRRDLLSGIVVRAEADAKAAAVAERGHAELAQLLAVAQGEVAALDENATEPIQSAATELAALVMQARADLEQADAAADAAASLAATVISGFEGRDAAVGAVAELKGAAGRLGEETERRSAAAQALAALEAAQPPENIASALLEAVETAEEQLRQAQANATDTKAAITSARNLFAAWAASGERAGAAAQELLEAERAAEEAAEVIRTAGERLTEAEAAVSAAEAAVQAARRANAAAAAAEGCLPGDDCPVCSTTLSPTFVPPPAGALPAATEALEAARAAVKAAEGGSRQATAAEARAGSQLEAAVAVVEASQLAVEAAAEQLRAALRSEIVPGLIEDEALAGLLADGEAAEGIVSQARHALATATHAAADARSALAAAAASWSAKHEQHAKDLEDAERALSAIRAALDRLPGRWQPGGAADSASLETLAGSLAEALEEHARLVEEEKQHRADSADAGRQLLELDTRQQATVTSPTDALVTTAARVRGSLVQLAERVDAEAYVPELATAEAPLADIAASVKALDAAARSLQQQAATECAALAEAAKSAQASVAAALTEAGDGTLGELQARYGAAVRDAVRAGEDRDRVQADAARATQIDETLEVAAPFLATLDALAKLLTDGRFIGDLVREREKALLIEASRILKKLSGGRFGFGDDFSVIDRDSRRERAAETLSGGERFQASLALALALVEIATRSGGQLEAVFVDEGFGSLDAASLDQALTTLGAVASDGKLVALVSHLRQVAEYVDQVLLVERTDAGGSQVKVLDPTERDALLAEDARSRMLG